MIISIFIGSSKIWSDRSVNCSLSRSGLRSAFLWNGELLLAEQGKNRVGVYAVFTCSSHRTHRRHRSLRGVLWELQAKEPQVQVRLSPEYYTFIIRTINYTFIIRTSQRQPHRQTPVCITPNIGRTLIGLSLSLNWPVTKASFGLSLRLSWSVTKASLVGKHPIPPM